MENKKTLLENMVQALNESGAEFIAVKINGYTIMATNDGEGAEYLCDAWDRYSEWEA